MEKNMISGVIEVLNWLPVGYMINFPNGNFPNNFIEVDGQRLSKKEYQDVFEILKGNVIDDTDSFVLPTKLELSEKFNSLDGKIILKLRHF